MPRCRATSRRTLPRSLPPTRTPSTSAGNAAFEALLIAADAFKRAGAADPKALVDAIRTTNIADNISMGPGIQFNEKGRNNKLKNGAIRNRAGKFATIAPNAQSDAKPELPMTPYDKRG